MNNDKKNAQKKGKKRLLYAIISSIILAALNLNIWYTNAAYMIDCTSWWSCGKYVMSIFISSFILYMFLLHIDLIIMIIIKTLLKIFNLLKKRKRLVILTIVIFLFITTPISLYFVSQNLPFRDYADENIYFSTNGFIFSTISKREIGAGQTYPMGYYYYNPITKKFKRTLEWDCASTVLDSHYSGKEYNVILRNRKFFIYGYEDELYSLVNEDLKKTPAKIKITGLYKSEYNKKEIYIIDENTYLLYDSKEGVTEKLSYETYDCGNSFYYLDIDSGVIYNKKTNSIYGYKKEKNIPTYFNMSSLNIYEQNKNNIKQKFVTTKVNSYYDNININGEDVMLIGNDFKENEKINIVRWDKNYVYLYINAKKTYINIKYNIKTNKYKINDYYEVLDDETNN